MVEELWKKTLEQAASNIRERRTGPRYSFVAGAEFVDVQTNSRMPGRASDLDRGGCFIDTLNPFPVGTALTLRLTNENQSFRVQAEVAYVQMGMGMGLSFTVAEAEQLRILDGWIAGLAGPLALTRSSTNSARSAHSCGRTSSPPCNSVRASRRKCFSEYTVIIGDTALL